MGLQIALAVVAPDLQAGKIQVITRELARSLREQNVGEVTLQENEGKAGYKGDPITVGSIIMTLIASGGVATSLIGVMKAYFERSQSFKLDLVRPDGRRLSIDATHVSTSQIDSTTKLLNEFLAG